MGITENLKKKNPIFAFMEIKKKKTKGQKLYLKQYWLKTSNLGRERDIQINRVQKISNSLS